MKVYRAERLPEVIIIEPDVFEDGRGYFLETYQEKRYRDNGVDAQFVQDNVSFSKKGVLRGLHYQFPNEQAKLVQVIRGQIFDVAVDIRKGSPTFGQWTSVLLSDVNKRQVFIPAGFAHGFCVLSETAYVTYKCSDFYAPDHEGGILWSDPDIGIEWVIKHPIVSGKDASYPLLKEINADSLPNYGKI